MKIKPPLRPVRVRSLAGHRLVDTRRPIKVLIPGLNHQGTLCPECFDEDSTCWALHDLIVHLNDQHDWTLMQLADWLDTLPYDLTVQDMKIPGAIPRGRL